MADTNPGVISPDLLPVHLEFSTTSFKADGHTYYVEHNAPLSLARNRALEKFGLYSIMARDGRALMAEVRRAYDALNAGKPIDCGVILDNVLSGIADLNAREAPLMYICTLFINREDEDRMAYDQELGKQKIAAWTKEGIEAQFFFHWALNYLKITDDQLSMFTQISLSNSLPKMTLEGLSPSEGK